MQRFWARLTVLVMLLTLIPVSAAQAATKAKPALVSLSLPAQVNAGQTVDIIASVTVDKDAGLCDGSLTLKGPSGQSFSVQLARADGTTSTVLKGEVTLSPNAPAGVYTVSNLTIIDNDDDYTSYTKDTAGFTYSLTVVSAGNPQDTKGPKLTGLTVTESAEMGDPVTITATTEDDLSGVDRVYAYVEPVVDQKPWRRTLQLFPTDKSGVYSGTMLADSLNSGHGEQRVVKVSMYDKAGNNAVVEGKDLTDNPDLHRSTTVKDLKVPAGLITSPFMRVIHPGDLTFWNWATADRSYLLGLLNQANQSTTTVRERVVADLGQLQQALDQVRKEIYVDPATGLKVSPFATTGKWMVLDRAFTARRTLLIDLDRREGKVKADALSSDELAGFYYLGDNAFWLPVNGALNDMEAQVPAAVLKVLAKAPTAVTIMKTPANESPYYNQLTQLDRDVIYFRPVVGAGSVVQRSGTNSFAVYPDMQLTDTLQELFSRVGQHFGQAYIAGYDNDQAAAKWSPYYSLRGGQVVSQNVGWLGTPANNLGDDFADSFLPLGLGQQYFSVQSFPRLRENPDMEKAFKQYVTDLVGRGTHPGSISVAHHVNVGTTANITFSATDLTTSSALSAGLLLSKDGATMTQLTAVSNGKTQTYSGTNSDFGHPYAYFVAGADADGRLYIRSLSYIRLPLMLDALSGATNQQVITISGSAPAGATVTIQGRSTTVGADGRFKLDVPLTEGDNLLKATVTGSPLAAAFNVNYTPASKAAKLKVTLAGLTTDKYASGTVETDAFATIIVGDLKFQADSSGAGTFYPPLTEGKNKVQVTVTNTAGNQATWTGNVTLDTKPPVLNVSVPKSTNLPVFKLSGSTDPGSEVMLNDKALEVDATGKFSAEIALADGQTHKLTLVATDPAGNQTTVVREIQQQKTVAAATRMSEITLSGKVDPGTTLTYLETKVTADSNGKWELKVAVGPGRNVYDLSLTDASGQPAGFLEYVVNNPLKLDTPTPAEDGKVKVSGQTAPGYTVIVDGQTAKVDEKGNWSVLVSKDGRDSIVVLVDGDGDLIQETVSLP